MVDSARSRLLRAGALARLSLLLACQSPDVGPREAGQVGGDGKREDAGSHEVVCCGCLCVDPSWSCAQDTCIDAQGHAHTLAPEAGFLEIPILVQPGWDHVLNDEPARLSARMWYAFRPADQEPAHKPLLVVMQGGPGSSVLPLWGGNTGPLTLDPRRSGEGGSENPQPWTRFANLLYIDTPWAGFSYQRPLDGLTAVPQALCDRPFDPDEEAASYVRTLLRFLSRHPDLQAAPVALVGESYAGVRVTLMLQQLLHSERLRDEDQNYRDSELAQEVEAHQVALAARGSELRAQFFAQVLIQPGLVEIGSLAASNPKQCDWHPYGSQADAERSLVEAMRDKLSALVLSTFVGVDTGTIRWLRADSRGTVCARGEAVSDRPDLPLAEQLGTLSLADRFHVASRLVREAYHFPRRDKDGELAGYPFADLVVESLQQVPTFITNARCDDIIDSEATLEKLGEVPGIAGVVIEDGLARIEFGDGESRTVRFPRYPQSGHVVSLHAPEALARDVDQFLADTLAQRQ